ncbi:3-keto-5-aminohexanoate cleavage protein [Bradyrhizobium yuanmingense]|uniref:3-keto-5-aminohexanoate cleavage protein n=1 Tax=Bradyrhizobium yuanmingense TaxID=108015 RepID=UPI0021A478D6|nr:3-keto-5-aminohexanoate cleavage protein [Bradyrhizobium sp. CB1024]UWU83132.1 3-keto-5-aminohexanoate cleavage protein [Bradyrhizobium sp. CB1024]
MISEVFVTCAVTGSATPRQKNVPITPEEIADSTIEAARAGAAVVHLHVRDLETRKGSRNPALYRQVVERIRKSNVNPVINLTAGPGCSIVLGGPESPLPLAAGTDMPGAIERLVHVEELRPEICSIDCGSMNWAGGELVMANSSGMLRAMTRHVQKLGVRPELEVFDTGHLMEVRDLVKEGFVDDPPLIQLCMGTRYGAPDDLHTLLALVHQLPPRAIYSTFAVGRMSLPWVALAPLVGANVRVGLEDNLYLSHGRLATNEELVQRAIEILDRMGVRIMGADEVREKLKLKVQA